MIKSKNLIFVNSIYNVLKTGITILFPLITYSYASRILLPEGMGKIDFSRSLISLFSILAMLGVRDYGMRECSRVRNNKEKISIVVKELLTINFITSFSAYVLLFLLLFLFPQIATYKEIILIFGLLIALQTIGVEWLYAAIEDFKYIAIRTCSVQVIALFLMLLFVRDKNDVWIYALVQVVSLGGSYLFSFVYSRKIVDYKIKCHLELKKHIKPLFMLFITSSFINIYVSLDSVMLSLMTDDVYTGYYSAAYKVSTVLCTIIISILQVITPRISYYVANGLSNDFNKLMNKAMAFVLLLGIPISVGAYMLSDHLIVILSGNDYLAASSASRVLSLRMSIGCINSLLIFNLFIPMKKDYYAVIVTSAAAITDIAVNFLLIPTMYHTGAAVSSIVAEGVIFVIGMILSSKLISFSEAFKKIWQYFIASVPIIIICDFLSHYIKNMILYVCTSVVCSAVVYFLILILFKNPLLYDFFTILKNNKKK